jgi:hypothetical protein
LKGKKSKKAEKTAAEPTPADATPATETAAADAAVPSTERMSLSSYLPTQNLKGTDLVMFVAEVKATETTTPAAPAEPVPSDAAAKPAAAAEPANPEARKLFSSTNNIRSANNNKLTYAKQQQPHQKHPRLKQPAQLCQPPSRPLLKLFISYILRWESIICQRNCTARL